MERFKAYKLTETPERKIRAEFVDMTLEDLDPGDVVIRVAYSDVNYKDALAATGKEDSAARKLVRRRHRLAGTVVARKPRFKKGDAVVGVGFDLGLASRRLRAIRARAGRMAAKLPHLTLWDAMAFGTAGYTAGIAIVRMEHEGLKPVERAGACQRRHRRRRLDRRRFACALGYHVVALTGKERSRLAEEAGREGDPASQVSTSRRSSRSTSRPGRAPSTTWAATCCVDLQHDEGQRHRLDRARGKPESQHHGDAVHSARRTLLGINSGESSNDVRDTVWRRLATDMKPLLKEMARTVPFSKLPTVFDDFINARVTRRVVVDLEGEPLNGIVGRLAAESRAGGRRFQVRPHDLRCHPQALVRVREEADGEAAWQAVETDPSLVMVFTDLEMPRLDGFSLLARPRLRGCAHQGASGRRDLRTRRGREQAAREGLGANDFIAKTADARGALAPGQCAAPRARGKQRDA